MFEKAERRAVRVATTLAAASIMVACEQTRDDLSTEQLSQAVSVQQPTLKQCYDAALAVEPYRQDVQMEAIIEIAPSGRVKSVKLDGKSGLPGMSDCIAKRIKEWRFPKADDATQTSLPLIFHPEVVHTGGPDVEALQRALQGLAPKATK